MLKKFHKGRWRNSIVGSGCWQPGGGREEFAAEGERSGGRGVVGITPRGKEEPILEKKGFSRTKLLPDL